MPDSRMPLFAVVDLGTPGRREAAILLAERAFGHLDMGGRTVRDELSEVRWGMSFGVLDASGVCRAFILAAPVGIPAFAETQEAVRGFDPRAFEGLRGIGGDALVIEPEVRSLGVAMIRRFLLEARQHADYLWGRAHPDLDNAGFWRRHATLLGRADDDDLVFALPLTPAAVDACRASLLPTEIEEPARGPGP